MGDTSSGMVADTPTAAASPAAQMATQMQTLQSRLAGLQRTEEIYPSRAGRSMIRETRREIAELRRRMG